jgi:hypothetical protein
MTVAELKILLEHIPDDFLVYMPVDDENVLTVSDESDLEEIRTENGIYIRVLLLRSVEDTGLVIPKTFNKN